MKKLTKCLPVFLMVALFMQIVAPGIFAVNTGTGEIVIPETEAAEGNESVSPIIGEAEDLREENAKHFICEDGSYIAVLYASPIHYEEDGEWKDIDNTLVLSDDVRSSADKATYVPEAGVLPVSIPQGFDSGQKLTLSSDGYAIGFGVSADGQNVSLQSAANVTDVEELASALLQAGAAPADSPDENDQAVKSQGEIIKENNDEVIGLDNLSSAVTYENVFPDTDLEYIVSTTSLKENIVVNAAQAEYIYRFDMDLGGLVPVNQDDGSIWLTAQDKPEEPVFVIQAPYMYDANSEYSGAVTMTLTDGILTVTADAEWINAADRAFPVIIDPTFILNNSSSVLDTYVNNSWLAPNANYSKSPNFYAGKRTTGSVDRTYIKFNLPALPADNVITNALFAVNEWNPFSHYPVLVYDGYKYSWAHNTLSWNNQPLSKNDNGLKTQANLPMITGPNGRMPVNGYYEINITDEVKRWYQNNSNGLVITSVDETKSGQIEMCSSRATMGDKPVLTINYKSAPVEPVIYEDDGVISIIDLKDKYSLSADGGDETVEYRIGSNGTWTEYETPFTLVRTADTTVYARVRDESGNISPIASIKAKLTLGEYTDNKVDLIFGENTLPVDFMRTYSSVAKEWFFSWDASIAKHNAGSTYYTLEFKDFNGKRQYFNADPDNLNNFYSSSGDKIVRTSGVALINGQSVSYQYRLYSDSCIYYFNLNGKLTAIEDSNNMRKIVYVWSANTLTMTDEVNRSYTVTFSNGKPINIVDAGNRQVIYTWDLNENLIGFTNAVNVTENYAYDLSGKLLQNGYQTMDYTPDGRVTMITQRNGSYVKYAYNDNAPNADPEQIGQIGTFTVSDSRGVSTVYKYNEDFNVSSEIKIIDPKDYLYNPGNVNANLPISAINPAVDYVIETYVFDGIGEEETPLYNEDGEGNCYYYEYDVNGNIINSAFVPAEAIINGSPPQNFSNALILATEKSSYTYNLFKQCTELLAQEKTAGVWVNKLKDTNIYNSDGRKTQHLYEEWENSTWVQKYGENYTYNSNGDVISATKADYEQNPAVFKTMENAYDIFGLCTSETFNANEASEYTNMYSYDALGRTISQTLENEIFSYIYNNQGDITSYVADGKTTSYDYDLSSGNLLSRTDDDNLATSFAYDAFGNLTSQSFEEYMTIFNKMGAITQVKVDGTPIADYSYTNDTEQKLAQASYANNQSVSYNYDSEGRITSISHGGAVLYEYSYNTETVDDETREWTVKTDRINNIKTVVEGNVSEAYDISGISDALLFSVEEKQADPEDINSYNGILETFGAVTYAAEFEENKDTFKRTGGGDFERSIIEGSSGKELIVILSSGIDELLKTEYISDSDDKVSNIKQTLADESERNLSYTYDNKGNILTAAYMGQTAEYTYDGNAQLIRAEDPAADRIWEYDYDNRGNILEKRTYDSSATLIGTDSYAYGNAAWPDQLTGYNNNPITYDAAGNPLSYMGTALTWTGGRQLACVGGNISYTYSAEGIRHSKTVNSITTTFALDGAKILEQSDGTDTLHFRYDNYGNLIGFVYDDADYFYMRNLNSDIIAILDNTGNIIVEYTYDAWGALLSITGPAANTIGELNPFRYRSYYYDGETGRYYLQSRYYDPETGRFINADELKLLAVWMLSDIVMNINPFAYCINNPVMYFDSTGYHKDQITADNARTLLRITAEIGENTFKDVNDKKITVTADMSRKILRFVAKLIKNYSDLVLDKDMPEEILNTITKRPAKSKIPLAALFYGPDQATYPGFNHLINKLYKKYWLTTYLCKNRSELSNKWKNIPNDLNVVIMAFHGEPTGMAPKGLGKDDLVPANFLSAKNIDTLILLVCNIAHQDRNNYAKQLMERKDIKIRQLVGCDGTFGLHPNGSLWVSKDDVFKYYLKTENGKTIDRKMQGFLLYTKDKNGNLNKPKSIEKSHYSSIEKLLRDVKKW